MAGKKSKKPAKTGRPSMFSSEMERQAMVLAEKGFTDKEIAEVIGITQRTFNNWKKNNPEFFHTLKDWKEKADRKVERSLYERACGYEHPDTHISNYQGVVTTTDIIKHYPPDPVSMIFWLKNRDKEHWRDKSEVDYKLNVDDLNKILKELPEDYAVKMKAALISQGKKE